MAKTLILPLQICLCVCVWPKGLCTSNTHEMERPRGAENFLNRSLSMSSMHGWASPLETHPAPSRHPLARRSPGLALFPMADSDTDSQRCRTATLGSSRSPRLQPRPDPAADPFARPSAPQASVEHAWVHVRAPRVCASVRKTKRETSQGFLPLRATCSWFLARVRGWQWWQQRKKMLQMDQHIYWHFIDCCTVETQYWAISYNLMDLENLSTYLRCLWH